MELIKIIYFIINLLMFQKVAVISPDTWFNFSGNILGALIGAIGGGIVAYYVASNQAQEQAKLQTRQLKEQADLQAEQLEKQAKRDIQRERTLIAEKLKLDTYLKLNTFLTEYRENVVELHDLKRKLFMGMIREETYGDEESKITMLIMPKLIREISNLTVVLSDISEQFNDIKWRYEVLIRLIDYGNTLYYLNPFEFINDKLFTTFSEEEKEEIKIINESYKNNPAEKTEEYYEEHQELVEQLLKDVRTKVDILLNGDD